MFQATTAVLQQVSHLPPASYNSLRGWRGGLEDAVKPRSGPHEPGQSVCRAGAAHCEQKPEHRASGPGSVHTVPGASGSDHQGLSLLICIGCSARNNPRPALGCMYLPGPSRSGSGTRVVLRGADSVVEARFPARRREERGCGPVTGKDRASCQSGGAPALRPGAIASKVVLSDSCHPGSTVLHTRAVRQ